MKKSSKIILLSLAGVLILGGIAGVILSLILDKPSVKEPAPQQTTALTVHDAASFDTDAEDVTVELEYDDDGIIKSEKYYKSGTYYGRLDYYYGEDGDYTTLFNAAGEEIGASKTSYNSSGSISLIEHYANGALTKSVEYAYYPSGAPKKKLTKLFEGENVFAEKIYYSETGKKSEVIRYENDNEVEHVYYDENGNIKGNGGGTK